MNDCSTSKLPVSKITRENSTNVYRSFPKVYAEWIPTVKCVKIKCFVLLYIEMTDHDENTHTVQQHLTALIGNSTIFQSASRYFCCFYFCCHYICVSVVVLVGYSSAPRHRSCFFHILLCSELPPYDQHGMSSPSLERDTTIIHVEITCN